MGQHRVTQSGRYRTKAAKDVEIGDFMEAPEGAFRVTERAHPGPGGRIVIEGKTALGRRVSTTVRDLDDRVLCDRSKVRYHR